MPIFFTTYAYDPAHPASPHDQKLRLPLPPELVSLLRQKKMPTHSPILVRIFKEEAELEVWKQDTSGRFQIIRANGAVISTFA